MTGIYNRRSAWSSLAALAASILAKGADGLLVAANGGLGVAWDI